MATEESRGLFGTLRRLARGLFGGAGAPHASQRSRDVPRAPTGNHRADHNAERFWSLEATGNKDKNAKKTELGVG